jgi:hypothetical protein
VQRYREELQQRDRRLDGQPGSQDSLADLFLVQVADGDDRSVVVVRRDSQRPIIVKVELATCE